MDSNPSILVLCDSSTKPLTIIKLISKSIPEDTDKDPIIHPWKIETKYYTALVNLVGLESNYKGLTLDGYNIEALVIHMDADNPEALNNLKVINELEDLLQPEVKLLIADYCNENTKITKPEAIQWCSKRGYEFIELFPPLKDPDEDDAEIIPEKFGVDRVVEALSAHVWSNLVMKKSQLIDSFTTESKIDSSTSNFEHEHLADNFTELFTQLHVTKENIQSMPPRERKLCAEQMVTAFWNAIGGDSDELSDL